MFWRPIFVVTGLTTFNIEFWETSLHITSLSRGNLTLSIQLSIEKLSPRKNMQIMEYIRFARSSLILIYYSLCWHWWPATDRSDWPCDSDTIPCIKPEPRAVTNCRVPCIEIFQSNARRICYRPASITRLSFVKASASTDHSILQTLGTAVREMGRFAYLMRGRRGYCTPRRGCCTCAC
jgi:hypothetical protein